MTFRTVQEYDCIYPDCCYHLFQHAAVCLFTLLKIILFFYFQQILLIKFLGAHKTNKLHPLDNQNLLTNPKVNK